jgi:hypothetical protein
MNKSAGAGALVAAMGNHAISKQKHPKKLQVNEKNTYSIQWDNSERANSVFNAYFVWVNHAHARLMASDKVACDANWHVQLRSTRRRFINIWLKHISIK